jgi:L(+)-tartrate dehydratase alpha subunit
MITQETIYQCTFELHKKTATILPQDVRTEINNLSSKEEKKLSQFVLSNITKNWVLAEEESRPLCADTGLPRYFIKCGNNAKLEGGFCSFEKTLRQATADATHAIPLRPNRVHPLTRKDYNNNVGAHAPDITYSFEPEGNWIDITTVHKGGLFGSDYRMLFPSDGIPGLKRFYLDTIGQSFVKGLSCPPVIIGIGIGGSKDKCFSLGQEASLLRTVGDRHPDEDVAALERELIELGNKAGFGPMGFPGTSAVMDVHIEIAFAHTGGMPVAIHHFCFATRRATARVYPHGDIEYRQDPQWFTPYYRRETIG